MSLNPIWLQQRVVISNRRQNIITIIMSLILYNDTKKGIDDSKTQNIVI